MKFAHMGDCHLGGWRQPELKELNFKSFQKAVDICLSEKVDFVLMAGDLFDFAYPPIDTLKDTFREFRKFAEQKIQVFLIPGSHDYSASGKTFLDVLEKAGFCKNVSVFEERQGKLMLEPTIFRNVAIYGYPGKKSGLEVDDLERIRLQDAPGLFKILMLHTAIRDAVGTLPIKAVDEKMLPKVDYLALAHLHIIDNGKIRRHEVRLKQVISLAIESSNALTLTDEIIKRLGSESLQDKIVIIKLYGFLEHGKTSDIDFSRIEDYVKKQGVYVLLKSTAKLQVAEQEILIDLSDSVNIEEHILKKFSDSNPGKFNDLIFPLFKSLQIDKGEDEKSAVFEDRLLTEVRKILQI